MKRGLARLRRGCLALLTLGAARGTVLTVKASGPDAEQAIAELAEIPEPSPQPV